MIFDTYAWIEYFQGTEKGDRIRILLKNNECFTSLISIAEISNWIENKNMNRGKIMKVVKESSKMIELDEEILEIAGIIKKEKRKTIKDMGLIDSIIIATSRKYGLKILTGDPHFQGENVEFL